MQVEVDWDRCENHGQCTIAAPEVFTLDDAGKLSFDPMQVAAHLDDVEEAADVCPVQAIRISANR